MHIKFSYLQDCLTLFPKMTIALYDKEYNMNRIVRKFKHVAMNDSLSQNDLMLLIDAEEWDYKKFWPDLSSKGNQRKPIEGCFKLGWKGRETAVRRLYDRFQHIEVVSIVLRFVDPENYGIISPPVEKFLGLQPQDNHIKYYLTYLNVLNDVSRHYGRPSNLADVDMAIWCLSHLLKNWGNREFRRNWSNEDQSKIYGMLNLYAMDPFLKKQRLHRVLCEVYEHVKEGRNEPNRLLLAECLNDNQIDPELAMVATSYTFESFVWKLIEEAGLKKELLERRLRYMIKKLAEKLDKTTIDDFDKCKTWRDSATHPWLPKLNADNRNKFVGKAKHLVGMKKDIIRKISF